MTNLEKIDCAVSTTLEAHPDYQEIMTEILMKKVLDDDPFVTAKFFSRANDARAHMIEVSNLDLLAEIIKNSVKVSYLMAQKGIVTTNKEEYLDGSQDDMLFGSTACRWLTEQLKENETVNVDDVLEKHPEILALLVSVFKETRYDDSIITRTELDDEATIKPLSTLLNRIDQDILIANDIQTI